MLYGTIPILHRCGFVKYVLFETEIEEIDIEILLNIKCNVQK